MSLFQIYTRRETLSVKARKKKQYNTDFHFELLIGHVAICYYKQGTYTNRLVSIASPAIINDCKIVNLVEMVSVATGHTE